MYRTILVATDGEDGALGALRTAQWLADRDGSRVEVLAVYEPAYLSPIGFGEPLPEIPVQYTREAIDALRSRVRMQLVGLGGRTVDEVVVETGPVAANIARVAAELGAELILVGLAHDAGLQRWWSRETLLRLIHLAHVPVMGVPPGVAGLPKQAVAGTDFSEFSVRAAREAARELGPGGRLHLVHVLTGLEASGALGLEEWSRTYREGADRRLARLADELAAAGDVAVQVHMRSGHPEEEILKLAEETGADLIAVGSHGEGFLGRIIVGSVSGKVIHQARCAVLITTPQEIVPELNADMSAAEHAAGRSGG